MSANDHIPELESVADRGLLRFLTCGSVDDGKSTLIGRLLYDTRAILADTLHAIERTSQRRGLAAVDLSLLTDGLEAEREQGITIDVAYRYFSTGTRKYIIADAPGHEQYTRNMVTAGSTADLAILLVDARKGLLAQTRRHAALAHWLGIPRLLVAVNKMDLVDYDAAVFARIRDDFIAYARLLGAREITVVPISALCGDMLVDRGASMPWYDGPTVLEFLETAPGRHDAADIETERLRFPVQYVCRPQRAQDALLHDFRGYMGRVESGGIAVGDTVRVLPAGQETRVSEILLGDVSLPYARADQSVTIRLADEVDICRGDLIVAANDPSAATVQALTASLCWLGDAPLDPRRKYVLRHTTRTVRAIVDEIEGVLDIATLAHAPAETLRMNDIGRVRLKLGQRICVDAYRDNRATGAFILVDETTNATVAAGLVESVMNA